MNPEKLKNLYSEPPQDFHNAVLSALVRLDDKAPVRYKRHRIVKAVIACAIVLALGSSSVFAAQQVWKIFSDPVGNYGLKISADISTADEAPEYVKLVLGYLPDGVVETPHTNGMKYSLEGNSVSKTLCFSLIKLKENYEYTIDYVAESTETTVNGNRVIISNRKFFENDTEVQKGFNIYFDKWNMVLSCICSSDISDDELNKIIAGISLAEGTSDDCFEYSIYPDDFETDYTAPNEQYNSICQDTYTEMKVNTPFEYNPYKSDDNTEKNFEINVRSVEIKNNSDGLDIDKFRFNEYWINENQTEEGVYDDFFNADGSVVRDYERSEYTYGDGINSIGKYTNSQAKRNFIVATLEVTGLAEYSSEEPYDFDVSMLNLQNLIKSGSNLYRTNDSFTGYMVYYETDRNNLAYISKGETRTIRVGFFVDDDKLDSLYFTMKTYDLGEMRFNSVTQEYYSTDDYLCFKVER